MSTYIGKRIIPKHCGVWNSNTEYEMLSVVFKSDDCTCYMARKAVPAGTLLTNTDYWAPCADFSTQYVQAINAAVESWLDVHPEATTTVEDESLTYHQLERELLEKVYSEERVKSTLVKSCGGGFTNRIRVPLVSGAYNTFGAFVSGTRAVFSAPLEFDGLIEKYGSSLEGELSLKIVIENSSYQWTGNIWDGDGTHHQVYYMNANAYHVTNVPVYAGGKLVLQFRKFDDDGNEVDVEDLDEAMEAVCVYLSFSAYGFPKESVHAENLSQTDISGAKVPYSVFDEAYYTLSSTGTVAKIADSSSGSQVVLFDIEAGVPFYIVVNADYATTYRLSVAFLDGSWTSLATYGNVNAGLVTDYSANTYSLIVGTVNNQYDGLQCIRLYTEDEACQKIMLYKSGSTDFVFTPEDVIAGIYRDRPDGITTVNALLGADGFTSCAYADMLYRANPKYKNFKGIYDRFKDGKIYEYPGPYGWDWARQSTPFEYYYEGEVGDCYLYLEKNPKVLDRNIAQYGDIIYFDGTCLIAEENPFRFIANTRKHDRYDVCIIGGGSGGIGAAYALKDSGLKVCLVEKLGALGGTNLQAGVLNQIAGPVGDWYRDVCEKEYDHRGVNFATTTYSYGDDEDSEFIKYWNGSMRNYSGSNGNMLTLHPYVMAKRYEDDLIGSIDILYNREVVGSTVIDGTIMSATFRNRLTGGEETIVADFFIDCTGDDYLLRQGLVLGEDFFIGSDDADTYNESAIKSGYSADPHDINTLEPCYMWMTASATKDGTMNRDGKTVRYVEDKTVFPTLPDVTSGAYNAEFNAKHCIGGYVERTYMSNDFTITSPDYYAGLSRSDFVDHGYDYVWWKSIYNAQAHYLLRKGTVEESIFVKQMPLLAIREGYRMKCEYMMTQADVETTITSENLEENEIIALASWYVDIHNQSSVNVSATSPTYMNGVPYGALIPCAYKNALVASRGLGVSHVAAAAIRLTRTMLSVGYAAGKAVELARKNWLDDVRDVDVAELQETIGIAELLARIESFSADDV